MRPDLDTLVVPIGGGGLISGMAIAAKALKPSIRIVGVETELYPSMYNALNDGSLASRGDSDRRRHRRQECRRADRRTFARISSMTSMLVTEDRSSARSRC